MPTWRPPSGPTCSENCNTEDPLTIDDVRHLSGVTANGNPIQNLTPDLTTAPSWRSLNVISAELSELAPLRNLTNILSLSLNGDRIKDISPLSGMSQLQYLDLNNNQISDLAPLAQLTSLDTLYLSNNKVNDLSPLKNVTHLWTLYVAGNPDYGSACIS